MPSKSAIISLTADIRKNEKGVFDGIQIYLDDASSKYERTIVTVVEEGGRLLRYESDIYGDAEGVTDMTE